jgi:hypothetical protein
MTIISQRLKNLLQTLKASQFTATLKSNYVINLIWPLKRLTLSNSISPIGKNDWIQRINKIVIAVIKVAKG